MTRFEIGRPLPRALDAYAADEKWTGWILSPRGHGVDWYRVAGHVTAEDLWRAIVDVIEEAPVLNLRVTNHGISCGVRMVLTINDRPVTCRTAWHYHEPGAAPRLLAAYPTT